MKRPILIFVLVCLLTVLPGCGGKKTTQQQADIYPQTEELVDTLLPDSLFFMLQDKPLPMHVDIKQDISRLSYSQLRLLRSYVYAIHAHWFMEGELNAFFSHHTTWYDSLTYATWCDFSSEDDSAMTRRAEDYFKALEDDNPGKAYDMIRLTPEERDFVARIDARMALLAKNRRHTSAEGINLLNPDMAVNSFQLYRPDPSVRQLLYNYNMAMQPSPCQQLFNIYEANDYHCIPNFVTADVMLQATHIYFSYVLKSLEQNALAPAIHKALGALLLKCRDRMSVCPEMRSAVDVDLAVYCAVGLKLLGSDPMRICPGVDKLMGEYGMNLYNRELVLIVGEQDDMSPLFRTRTYFPYSMFKPRGHYTRNEMLERYFRAMMWLQKGCYMREDRMQMVTAVNMATLINETPVAQRLLSRVNQTIGFLMGRPDNVSVIELATWLHTERLGNADINDEETLNRIDKWLKQQCKTANRIRPKVDVDGWHDELNLMPGRYTSDGEILNTLYDPKPDAPRAYPSGVDVMDVMGVEEATKLAGHRSKEQPWNEYKKQRAMQQERCSRFNGWDNTLYDKWMHILLKMQEPEKNIPTYMQTVAWRRKNLNTSLASWALLKHDAVLYSEQPLAAECGGAGLPDPMIVGYVEPNLPFWKELESLIALTEKMLARNGFLTDLLQERGKQLADMVVLCRSIAEKELEGKPLTWEEHRQLRHIGSSLEWFTLSVIDPSQMYSQWDDIKGPDRCVAQVSDVFTRNILGCKKDGILYEAAGLPMELYVVVEINGRFYLTRGAAYSYYEFVRPLGDRLTDEQWQEMLYSGKDVPQLPEWIQPFITRLPVRADERFVYSTGC